MFKKIFITTVFVSVMLLGQDKAKRHEFEIITKVPATEVKSQDKTGTCWAFATASFLESELLRMNKGKFNLSEMFIARKAYDYKTEKYFRYHGDYNMNEGRQANSIPCGPGRPFCCPAWPFAPNAARPWSAARTM